jgi:hypothetical protein
MELDYFDFFDKYKPIKNHIDANAAEDGCMFETFGLELEFVKQADPSKVWTLVEDDEGFLVIVNGYHHVNRMGYLITEVPFVDTDEICVYFESVEERQEMKEVENSLE